jgi:hypothetical protein
MFTEDDFQYALENTQVLVAPQSRIETFGNTRFRFILISELMDRANQVRVRDGHLQAERPQIMTPGHYAHVLLEGFGERAREFAEWLERHPERFALLRYGFQFKKSEVTEELVESSMEKVVARVKQRVRDADDPLSVVIQGVDDAWEVCLLKFTVDMIQQSAGGNMGDFKRRGLL